MNLPFFTHVRPFKYGWADFSIPSYCVFYPNECLLLKNIQTVFFVFISQSQFNFKMTDFNVTSEHNNLTLIRGFKENMFQGVFENRTSKFVSVFISILLTTSTSFLIYGIIWFEKFGSDNKRTLMNKFVSSQFWSLCYKTNYRGNWIPR